jgi:hypothetical protein
MQVEPPARLQNVTAGFVQLAADKPTKEKVKMTFLEQYSHNVTISLFATEGQQHMTIDSCCKPPLPTNDMSICITQCYNVGL